MTEYVKLIWKNTGDSGAIPINAENLNHIEEGIENSFGNIKEALKNNIGFISFYCKQTPPDGWLVCDGRAVSRDTYEDLFDVLCPINGNTRTYPFGAGDGSTTFNLPDLRGEFIRGYNGGNTGIDAGRTFGSKQDATRFTTAATGARYVDNGETEVFDREPVGGNTYSENIGIIGVRPYNIALLPCIFTGVFSN